ncbi:MAG: hypothetical protein Q7Q71_14660 [Verrucomicrobiota bacterium JB023]|nr:hypothetical protein [Verrucomicrobiota bacterium JB023]
MLIAKVAGLLLVVWLVVFGIKSLVAPHQATPEKVNRLVSEANFEDYSDQERVPNSAIAEQREEVMEEVAEVVNRLGLEERETTRDTLEGFWAKMSGQERERFVDLTMESFYQFFEALDAMTPEARRSFVEKGLRELEDGSTERRLERLMSRDPQILEKITENGMKAYFDTASAETKMELAPFLKATNEVLQGMRGKPFQGQ